MGTQPSYSIHTLRAPPKAKQNQIPPSTTRRAVNVNKLGRQFRYPSVGMFTPEMAKRLAALVKMEKDLLRSYENVAMERKECANQLSYWGEDCDDDISDISDKLGVLLYEIGELEEHMVDRYDQYRVSLKTIRDIEASVQPTRVKKEKLLNSIYDVRSRDPESPKLITMEQELVREEAACLVAEAQLTNITRENFKRAFTLHIGTLLEHSEKVAILCGYAKKILDLLDDTPIVPGEPRPIYDGYNITRDYIVEAERELANWQNPFQTPEPLTDIDGLPSQSHYQTQFQASVVPRTDVINEPPRRYSHANGVTTSGTTHSYTSTGSKRYSQMGTEDYQPSFQPNILQSTQVVDNFEIGEEDDEEVGSQGVAETSMPSTSAQPIAA
ncbi:meiotic eisosome BAR domain protein Pil2 [Schizosaccharomyces pombe]|uniref:Probable sphingolipid long chain base-responsive protein pil2 n=1 Tax=Schizosaccharomyces pombe (strain 972 / ATCC 24843) TaxID=284812 RepID=PIL2_SCHPO|nr:putative protein kinase inhibitor [Schizosaccharomyces pombe]O14128.1 RecName: Full=Probable sphingolipid long chain base-responsive protein pil2; AltName: Full=Protein kinase inhibitor pil2 [Schizosaccharomyces pombe 972h-]CAB16733.1 protein kinase inhibitor associated with endocytosis (predicted) [Schizosaccharomyces pombe]|eukprot:NP_593603.1 putative protein kinase inhibitor [Schizosaccharomyces pombe]